MKNIMNKRQREQGDCRVPEKKKERIRGEREEREKRG